MRPHARAKEIFLLEHCSCDFLRHCRSRHRWAVISFIYILLWYECWLNYLNFIISREKLIWYYNYNNNNMTTRCAHRRWKYSDDPRMSRWTKIERRRTDGYTAAPTSPLFTPLLGMLQHNNNTVAVPSPMTVNASFYKREMAQK